MLGERVMCYFREGGIISLSIQAQSGCQTQGRAPLIGNALPGVGRVLAKGNSADSPFKKKLGRLDTWPRGLTGQCHSHK